ncbi:MAG: polymer-forming cytoskeletal protein [Duganella sp.]
MTMWFAGAAQATNFNGAPVGNCTLAGNIYTCSTIFANDNDTANIASGYTVRVSANLTFGYFQDIKMAGTARLETTGSFNISITNTQQNNFDTGGATIKAGGNFSLGNNKTISANIIATTVDLIGSPSKITGTITATGTVNFVSSTQVSGAVSAGDINIGADARLGSTLTATGAIKLESRVVITGAVGGASIKTDSDAKINGPVKIAGLADFASGNIVTGDVEAGSLRLRSANATINGNVNISGNVTLENSTVINGDLKAYDVRTEASSAKITGNAAVNSLYLGYAGSVGKVVTCTGPGGKDCNCVTRSDQYDNTSRHTCAGAQAPSSAHHFQITHGGYGLTCQPQPVTVTACANAACSAPHYSGTITATLQPGGGDITISGGTSNATVSRSTAGPATLSATGATTNPTTCVDSKANTNSCNMTFSDNGLTLTAPDHVSMTTATVTVQALSAPPAPNEGKSCVPLLANTNATINFSCNYRNPVNAANTPLMLKNADNASSYTNVSCGNSMTGVALKFDSNGKANAYLQYAEVGTVSLAASYVAGNSGASSPVASAPAATTFTAAPYAFRLRAVRVNSTPTLPSGVFARASEQFTLTVDAINALPTNTSNLAANITTNFGKENTPEKPPAIARTVTNPTGGVGDLTGKFDAVTNGRATGTWSFDDVGTITLNASNDNSSKRYLGILLDDFQTKGTLQLGRFIPDHFDTSLPVQPSLDVTMPCSDNKAVAPCDQRFVYSRQPFYVVVTAYNGAVPPTPTRNYTGVVSLSAWSASGTNSATPVSDGMQWSSTLPGAARFGFVQGVGTTLAANLPYFKLPDNSDPTQFYLRAEDTDGVTSVRTNAIEQRLTSVIGRLLVSNNFGSTTSSMQMTLQAQFLDSKRGGYLFNPAYSDTLARPLKNALVYSQCRKSLAADANTQACNSAARLALTNPDQQVTFDKGIAKFRLQPPSPVQNGAGSVGISLNKPCGTGGACTPTGLPWIDYLPSTSGTATFGIYRSGPVIYTREVY